MGFMRDRLRQESALNRLRYSEERLHLLFIKLLQDVPSRREEAISRTIRIVDGTVVKQPGKTGSQRRILYSIRVPS